MSVDQRFRQIDSIYDFSHRGLGELKAWIETWLRPDVQAMKAGGGGTTLTIQDEGVDLPQELKLNFIGSTVVATDNPGNSRTDVTISGGVVTRKLVATWSGIVPSVLGNGGVWQVPYDADGTTSLSFTLEHAYGRIETPSVLGSTAWRIEKMTPGADSAFSPATITTVTVAANHYQTKVTGFSNSVSSGDLLRIVFTAVASEGSTYHVELVGTQ